MLHRLYVDNFRCLVNFEFLPDQVNLVLGKNGSGKSTLLETLKVLERAMAGEAVSTVFTPDSVTWWDRRKRQTFELELSDAGLRFSYRLVLRHGPAPTVVIEEEQLELGGALLISFNKDGLRLPSVAKPIPFDGKQSVLGLGLGTAAETRRFQALVANLLTFRLNPWSFELAARREHRMLNVSGDNIVGFLRAWSQEDPEAFVAWKRRALAALPSMDDLQLRELEVGSRMLVGTKTVDGSELLMSLDSFSEGERALLALHAIAGIARKDRLIALDEPDNFLAPSEVQPILREFTIEPPREAAQLIVVTHHPETIDFLASYTTWMFEKGADGLARVRKVEFDRAAGERPTESVLAELAT